MFNPLRALRAIYHDGGLTTTEKAILSAIVMLTNNKTGRVWGGQKEIARLAGCDVRSIKRFYASPCFQSRFLYEERRQHKRLYWMNRTQSPLTGDTESPDRGHSVPLSTTTTSSTTSSTTPSSYKGESLEQTFENDNERMIWEEQQKWLEREAQLDQLLRAE